MGIKTLEVIYLFLNVDVYFSFCPINFGSMLELYFENDLLLLFSIIQVQRITRDRPLPDNST